MLSVCIVPSWSCWGEPSTLAGAAFQGLLWLLPLPWGEQREGSGDLKYELLKEMENSCALPPSVGEG